MNHREVVLLCLGFGRAKSLFMLLDQLAPILEKKVYNSVSMNQVSSPITQRD